MSSNLIRYAFVATRARGMFANFLKAEDYGLLLKAQNLQEFEKDLRKIYPSQAATHAARPATGQGIAFDAPSLEDKIVAHFLDIVGKIQRSLPDLEKLFMGAVAMEYEVFNVKALLRGRIQGASTEKIRAEMMPMIAATAWDWQELLAEDEIPEILRILRSHPLGMRIVKAYLDKYLKTHNVYQLDSEIDIAYLTWLFDEGGKFGPGEAPKLQRLVGQRIDVANVDWILRFKEDFKMAPEEIMVELVPRGYHLKVIDLKKLAFAEDPKMVLSLLREYPWRQHIPADKMDMAAIETGLEHYLKEQYYRIFRLDALHFAGVVAFVLLAKAVAQDMIKILEATEYRVSRASVEPQLFYGSKV